MPQRFNVNEQIRATRVRLIDAEGNQVGVVPTPEALNQAMEANLDLVEVSPNADPPVCKILDFGKHLYRQRKREHDAKRKQVVVQIKEIRLRPKTDTHDRAIKMERARRFLREGNRVQLNMLFRGREMAHQDFGRERLLKFAHELEDLAKIETQPMRQGRRMNMMMTPRPSVTEEYRREKKKTAGEKKDASHSSRRVKAVSAPEKTAREETSAQPDATDRAEGEST